MAKKQTNLSAAQKVEIAVGITAAAVAAAGTYFLYGSKDAAKNRKKVKSWMLKAKAEALDALEDAKSMSREEYEELIESIAKTYTTVKGASRADIKEFKNEMKEYWQHIEKEGKQMAKKAAAVTTKKAPAKKTTKTKKEPAKKAVKKTTAKKTAKKSSVKKTSS